MNPESRLFPLSRWLLERDTRASLTALELLRPVGWKQKVWNAWWQYNHFGDVLAFQALCEAIHENETPTFWEIRNF